ncbi:T9SS type A sorting domain-containing protein [Labilibacter marinus]|uniref:T9SS type A sorting domain-containing protein n=1 Tax=Labilibacter marinus TaxID=1477105 RepID=UPI000831CC6B|nr:T9SS type A sorting domain-containing protein [Labilibacter marinus]
MKSKRILSFCVVILILFSIPTLAQTESGLLKSYTFATTTQYQRQYYTNQANYLQYESVINSDGIVYTLWIDNYELFCFSHDLSTDTWVKEKIETGHDGDIHQAFMGLTGDNQRVIVYSYNPYFNYGASTGYGKEFWDTTVAMVETPSGWESKTYFTQAGTGFSSNYGLLPYCITSGSDGKVHITLHRQGWYTYGGELHEIIIEYANDAVQWGTLTEIHTYAEGSIDKATAWIGRQILHADSKYLLYYKLSPTQGTYYIDYAVKNDIGWQTPVRLRTTTKGNYHYIDLDSDNDGNYYFMYIENNDQAGPSLWLDKNNISLDNVFNPFNSDDEAIKANLFPQDDGSTQIVVYLKDKLPKIFNYANGTLTTLDPLTFENSESETLWTGKTFQKIHAHSILSDHVNAYGYAGISNGSSTSNDITTYFAYPLLFVEIEWTFDTAINDRNSINPYHLYPNPMGSLLYIENIKGDQTIRIYTATGKLVITKTYNATKGIDVSMLPKGMYILNIEGNSIKFIKK